MEREILCPDRIHHTKSPSGYLQWHAWAGKMAKTHRQVKCTGCGLYAIWVPKKQREADERDLARHRADRPYIIGWNDGYEHATSESKEPQ